LCGICGKVYHDPQQQAEESVLRQMCTMLRHRGPDYEGVLLRGNLGLGHCRLSILDLSPAGRQPMCNEDGSIWIVCNGEIYNYRALRSGLARRGHRFASQTDTEVILHLYEDKGADCLADLLGMFAFALWDGRARKLLLARDRLGKKPLAYAFDERRLLFASELRALLADPGVSREVDPAAIDHYLAYQYIPAPLSIFKSIRKLPPAHYLVYEGGRLSLARYWDVACGEQMSACAPEAYKEQFLELFQDAVRLRLQSDVPFGAFLSGGIDSSLVVALMSKSMAQPVKTFSIGFEQAGYDELPYARMIARQFQTEHHERVVRPDVVDMLPRLVWHYSEPFADSSAIPTYCLAQMTREHVTVALNGDGGDEIFAGYGRYGEACRHSLRRVLPGRACDSLGALINLLPDGTYGGLASRLKRYLRFISDRPEERYLQGLCRFNEALKTEMYSREFRRATGFCAAPALIRNLYAAACGPTFLDRTLYVDLRSYLPEDLLVKVDIASMAHGLEARSPFLDHRLIEFATRIPAVLKLRGATTKYFLRQALRGLLPDEILQRPKMGFAVPLGPWLRSELRAMAFDTLLDSRASQRGYFRPAAIRRLLEEHSAGLHDHAARLWSLLWLELWHRMFVDVHLPELQPR